MKIETLYFEPIQHTKKDILRIFTQEVVKEPDTEKKIALKEHAAFPPHVSGQPRPIVYPPALQNFTEMSDDELLRHGAQAEAVANLRRYLAAYLTKVDRPQAVAV